MIKCGKDKKTIFNECYRKRRKTFCKKWMFLSVTLESPVFMGKNYSDKWHSIKNTKDLTMKQMFDTSAKLVSEQDEIYGVKTTDWENYSWKYLSLIGDEQVISLQRTKVYVFSDSVLCLGKIHENPNQTLYGNKDWSGSKQHRNTETWTELMVNQWNSSGIFSQDSLRCISVKKFKSLLLRLDETPENFTGRIIFMSMFNDISWASRENEKECESNARLVSLYARSFGAGHWSFLGPGSEKKWCSISADSPQGEWDRMAEKMMLEFGESRHPVFRATSPLSRGTLKNRGGGKLSIHFCADGGTIETVFRTIISVNQLSLYGSLAEMCEEYETFHDRTGQPVVGGQSSSSFVPSVIKTDVPLDGDDHAHKYLLLQKYGERIEKLSQQDKLSKFCMEVATCCLHGKYGVEIRIMSMNKDNSHSWVRIYHGLNKLVTNLNNNEQETSEVQFEEYALRLNANDFACRSMAKAKPQRRESAGSSTRTIPISGKNLDRCWTRRIFNLRLCSTKKLIRLLRHGNLPWEDDGAIEFWRITDDLQKYFLYCHHWSDDKWKKSMAGGGGNYKRYQYCTAASGVILYFRALQGLSGRSLIDPTLQDNVVFLNGFFQNIYHVGCAINLHSIINSGLIPGGQNLSKTDSILSVCGSHGQKP